MKQITQISKWTWLLAALLILPPSAVLSANAAEENEIPEEGMLPLEVSTLALLEGKEISQEILISQMEGWNEDAVYGMLLHYIRVRKEQNPELVRRTVRNTSQSVTSAWIEHRLRAAKEYKKQALEDLQATLQELFEEERKRNQ